MAELLTANEAATRAGVTERTVRRWITAGQLPAVAEKRAADGVTHAWRIDAGDLEQYMAAHHMVPRLAPAAPVIVERGLSAIDRAALERALQRIDELERRVAALEQTIR